MSKPKVLIVEARFYDHLADLLLEGAKAALDKAGANYDVVTVPGALEVPAAIAFAATQYDAFVALGVIIRGETYHFDIVADQSAQGIMNLTIGHKLCIGNGILTVENEGQALRRARLTELDKGGGAAIAALTMLGLKERFSA
jgi:6,7-dimethyl-8-ribityllumazine synthase